MIGDKITSATPPYPYLGVTSFARLTPFLSKVMMSDYTWSNGDMDVHEFGWSHDLRTYLTVLLHVQHTGHHVLQHCCVSKCCEEGRVQGGGGAAIPMTHHQCSHNPMARPACRE